MADAYPVRVLQFGDGVFLRAFIDWMIERMNSSGRFGGRVAVVKPRPGPFSPAYARQGLRYTVALKGVRDRRTVESRERIGVIDRLINPYEDFQAFIKEAENPYLACVVSNTTESGIAPASEDRAEDEPARSFPGKLTQLLRRRYDFFHGDVGSGLVILPCELIEDNGRVLRDLVLDHATLWYKDRDFADWLKDANSWLDSLVDRIVTGFVPDEKAAVLAAEGFEDDLVDVAEPYYFLALRGPASLESILPLKASGLNVVWAKDIGPYRELKLRLLNGSHTLMALCGPAFGISTVRDCLDEPLLLELLRAYQIRETIPTLSAPEPEAYLDSVLERFSNPYLSHKLENIATNSAAKWRVRIMPTAAKRLAARGRAPAISSFLLAALVDRYSSSAPPRDEPSSLAWFARRSREFRERPAEAMAELISPGGIWGDLPELKEGGTALAAAAAEGLEDIRRLGMAGAMRRSLERSARDS